MSQFSDRRNRLRAMVAFIGILLFAGRPALCLAQQRGQRLQATIAFITAGQDNLDKVRSLYGNGAEQTIGEVRSLCYYIEQDRAFLAVSTFEHENRVRQITLTTFADVAPGCRAARIRGKHLTALRGISLGDSIAKVKGTLGAPSASGKLPIPNRHLVYADYRIGPALLTFQYEQNKLVLVAMDATPE